MEHLPEAVRARFIPRELEDNLVRRFVEEELSHEE
jgi:hypothetical protein